MNSESCLGRQGFRFLADGMEFYRGFTELGALGTLQREPGQGVWCGGWWGWWPVPSSFPEQDFQKDRSWVWAVLGCVGTGGAPAT